MDVEVLDPINVINPSAYFNRPVRNYSDSERAKTLATLDLQQGNLSATSRITGIPLSTIADWKNGKHNDEVTELRNINKQELADRFEAVAHIYIDQAINTVEHSKGSQAVTGAAIATDKMRLLRDQSTVITSSHVDPIAQTMRAIIHNLNQHRIAQDLPVLTEPEIIAHLNKAAETNRVDPALLRAKVLGDGSNVE